VLLVLPSSTYRARDFLAAARELGVPVTVASDHQATLSAAMGDRALTLALSDPDRAAEEIAERARRTPFDAIVGVDDQGVLAAAVAAARLGLAHNPPDAVARTRDKAAMRTALAQAGVPQPRFALLGADTDPAAAAEDVGFPCVVKPLALSGSRGVIRADDAGAVRAAAARVRAILAAAGEPADAPLLIESYLPGAEVAVEALLDDGRLRVLAIFDKPDPLEGPYFEETLYVTPSRLPTATQESIIATAGRAATALGLRDGPLHAELRLGDGGPYVLEVAARSIGGLCSNALRFGTGLSLEELILRHAIAAHEDRPATAPLPTRERQAAGAMMLPIPRAGTLRAVRGRAEALAVPGVEEVTITIALGQPVRPLPEGDRYLGFVFARADTPAAVEAALREAHRRLGFVITAPGEPADGGECLPATPARRMLPVSGQ
jgi:biotin carboxylase